MAMGILLALVAGGGFLLTSALAAPQTLNPLAPTLDRPTQTETQTPVPTLDSWAKTGTALIYITASATPDYCHWLTPTGTFTPTLEHTPDEWSATGTAVYEATYPPRTATSTPDSPRVWCNNIPTTTPSPALVESTETQTELPTETVTPMPTSTQPPPPPPPNNGQQPGMPTPPGGDVVIEPPEPTYIMPTVQPTKTKKPKKTQTATPTPQSRLMSRFTSTPGG